MAQKVKKCGITRKHGYLYYVDKKGNIAEAKMARGRKKGGGSRVVCQCGVKKKHGYLYFVDKKGDICCAKMVRGGRRKKRKKRR
jgi:hypothetical protein